MWKRNSTQKILLKAFEERPAQTRQVDASKQLKRHSSADRYTSFALLFFFLECALHRSIQFCWSVLLYFSFIALFLSYFVSVFFALVILKLALWPFALISTNRVSSLYDECRLQILEVINHRRTHLLRCLAHWKWYCEMHSQTDHRCIIIFLIRLKSLRKAKMKRAGFSHCSSVEMTM